MKLGLFVKTILSFLYFGKPFTFLYQINVIQGGKYSDYDSKKLGGMYCVLTYLPWQPKKQRGTASVYNVENKIESPLSWWVQSYWGCLSSKWRTVAPHYCFLRILHSARTSDEVDRLLRAKQPLLNYESIPSLGNF